MSAIVFGLARRARLTALVERHDSTAVMSVFAFVNGLIAIGVMALLAYLGVMAFAVAYLLMYAGLRTVLGSAAVIATLLEPVTAAVLAAAVLGERLGLLGLVGAALILVAVAGQEGDDGDEGRVSKGPAPL